MKTKNKAKRVSETDKNTRSSFVRKAGKLDVLYSYATPVAVYDNSNGTITLPEEEWGRATTIHINRFAENREPLREVRMPKIELEERAHRFLYQRAKHRRLKTHDDAVDQIEAAATRAGSVKKKPPVIKVPLGAHVIFVNGSEPRYEEEDDE
jgi:hypothetical protein